MALTQTMLDAPLAELERRLAALALREDETGRSIRRWRTDAAALRFHLGESRSHPSLIAILGGTGTGKSTLLNRLLDATLSGTSFRRTYTAGAVAIASDPAGVPHGWLGVERVVADANELPVRGRPDALVIIPADHELTRRLTFIDTPDLDGDQPAHHAQADRVFRWAEAIIFLVTPEKYQMTELLPYYRLAQRYALPRRFVMNKCEDPQQVADYAELLQRRFAAESEPAALDDSPGAGAGAGAGAALPVFAIPRDDAAYEPPADIGLNALRGELSDLQPADPAERRRGLANRVADLVGRFHDQILAPLQDDRRHADRIIAALRAVEDPETDVDVNPLTLQLQRRLQQRSVLYLMGPRRMLDRVRQVPGFLVRLPRTTWDLVFRGEYHGPDADEEAAAISNGQLPDFSQTLADQFVIVQSRIDDVIRSHPAGEAWLAAGDGSYESTRLDPAAAGRIADEELAELRQWLEQRWNATPRDTMLLQKLLKHLPGGKKLTQWSEAAPYLLVIGSAVNNAFFGPIDLLVVGGYSLATWLTEKLSNEVAARARLTNRRIAERFTHLAHEQINRAIEWLDTQAPPTADLERLQRLAGQLAEAAPRPS